MSDEVAEYRPQTVSIFDGSEVFLQAEKMASFLAKSTLVPSEYRNNPSNVMIALDMANRMRVSPMMVMQHLHVIQGKPSFSSTFLLAIINQSGRFAEPLKPRYSGEGDNRQCLVWTKDFQGQIVESTAITIKMAKAEKWYDKPGSKWPNMPDQMLFYRAVSFFSRMYCSDITMGMYAADEVEDFTTTRKTNASVVSVSTDKFIDDVRIEELHGLLKMLGKPWGQEDVMARASQILKRDLDAEYDIRFLSPDEGERLIKYLRDRIKQIEAKKNAPTPATPETNNETKTADVPVA